MKFLTIIRKRFHNLMISKDTDDFGNGVESVAVLLFTPDLKEHDHYHITLNIDQVHKLHQWTGEFLYQVGKE